MLKNIKMGFAIALIGTMMFSTAVIANAAEAIPVSFKTVVDGKDVTLSGYTVDGGYNFYRLRDFAYLLNGSSKQFDIEYDKEKSEVVLKKDTPYTVAGNEMQQDSEIKNTKSLGVRLYMDGQKLIYTGYNIDGNIYFTIPDIMKLFNTYAVYDSGKNEVVIDTSKDFTIDFDKTVKSGYFDYLHAVIVGNVDTGEILYSNNANHKVSIASTTKIMTYLLIREAIEANKISWDDEVVLTAEAERLSVSEDGVIPMKKGQTATVRELVDGMLVVSSNEAATVLGEHYYGTEAKFVALMNARAKELGLTSAEFYNAHGLPTYTSDVLAVKQQNRMNIKELFDLTKYVMDKYPEVLDITSKTTIKVESLDFEGENTNRLLFQMMGANGFKTGTTNRAGACLAATMPVKVGEETNNVIAIVLGAEDSKERGEKTGMLLQYAKQYYNNK